MIIEKYGIRLIRLTEDDLELLREKRNSPDIQERMFYQEYISKDNQKKWFQSINNERHYYFIIEHKGLKIGLINGIIQSFETRSAEGGLFIWDKNYWGTHVPVIASICMADLTFFIMGMKKTRAEVRADNPAVVKYNLQLGYHVIESLSNSDRIVMEMTKENYLINAHKLRQTIQRISKDSEPLGWDNITFRKEDFPLLYENLPNYLKEPVLSKL